MKISLLKDVLPACALLGTGGGAGIGGTYAVMSSGAKAEPKELTLEEKWDINKRCNVADTEYTKVIRKRGGTDWTRELEREAAEEGKTFCDWRHDTYYNIYNFSSKFKNLHLIQ